VPESFHRSARRLASEALAITALPELIRWLQSITALPSDSTELLGTLYFNATYSVDGLVISQQPIYKVRRGK
jgi:hypothetical protein